MEITMSDLNKSVKELDLDWVPVASSNIKQLAWDDNELFVQFNSGKVYSYLDVFESTFEQLVSAKSVGSFFSTEIKPNFTCWDWNL